MAKEQKIEADGEIVEKLPNTQFRVLMDNGETILGYLSGKMRTNNIEVLPGDRVTVELSPYDLTKGRVIHRLT